MDKIDFLCYNIAKKIYNIDGADMRIFSFKRDSNYDKEYGNKDWLYINNFGYYFNISKDITSARPIPRADYHLLYVSRGEICMNGMTLNNGDAYLLLPQEPHVYTYKQIENSRYYWIHFIGNKASEILSHCEVSKGINKDNDRRHEKDVLFGMLAEELSRCSEEASDYAVSLLFSFLSLFKGGQQRKCLYTKAIRELENTQSDVSVASIAKLYNISPSHFIRSFKSIYGTTPNEYKQNYRLSQAMNLLRMTNLPIQDIAYQCGFCDPFYFSRIFKKRIGVSPYEYRKQE